MALELEEEQKQIVYSAVGLLCHVFFLLSCKNAVPVLSETVELGVQILLLLLSLYCAYRFLSDTKTYYLGKTDEEIEIWHPSEEHFYFLSAFSPLTVILLTSYVGEVTPFAGIIKVELISIIVSVSLYYITFKWKHREQAWAKIYGSVIAITEDYQRNYFNSAPKQNFFSTYDPRTVEIQEPEQTPAVLKQPAPKGSVPAPEESYKTPKRPTPRKTQQPQTIHFPESEVKREDEFVSKYEATPSVGIYPKLDFDEPLIIDTPSPQPAPTLKKSAKKKRKSTNEFQSGRK